MHPRWPRPRPLAWRTFAIVLGALAGVFAAALVMEAQLPSPGEKIAQAIERGRAPQFDPGAHQNEYLSGTETQAGYRWAEQHGITDATMCPTKNNSKAFRDGCVARAEELHAPSSR